MTTHKLHWKQKISPKRFVLGAVILVILIGSGIFLWIRHGNQLHATSRTAYQNGDCQQVLALAAQIERYPTIAGGFVTDAAQMRAECQGYVQAASLEDPATGIQAYEDFLAAYPDSALTPFVIPAIRDHYLAWGDALRKAGDFSDAIATYEKLKTDYTEFESAATDLVQETYLLWGADLGQAAQFDKAISVYEQWAAEYPQYQSNAAAQILATYLDWGAALAQKKDFAQTTAIYDELETRGGQFAEASQEPRCAALLDWGGALRAAKQYAEAEKVYKRLLSLEHLRRGPLPLSKRWPSPWPYPYGGTQLMLSDLQDILRRGPGDAYPSVASADMRALRSLKLFAIVGTSPDDAWIAVNAHILADKVLPEQGVHNQAWQAAASDLIVWLPIEAVSTTVSGLYGYPLSGQFVAALAAQSDWAARVQTELQTTYTQWAEAMAAQGEYEQAVAKYVALAELLEREPARREVWEKIASLYVKLAQDLTAQGACAASLTHTWYAEAFDAAHQLIPARQLRARDFLCLGETAWNDQAWQSASEFYDAVLALEYETYVSSIATTTQKISLYATPSPTATALLTAAPEQAFPVLARDDHEGQVWLLLLAPTVPAAQVWAPAEAVTLSTPLLDLPAYSQDYPPALQSHAALVRLAQVHQSWGQALYSQKNYQDALTHYQRVLDDVQMHTVITGTETLAARAWVDWGNAELGDAQYEQAIMHYLNALTVEPQSDAATEANAAMSDLLDSASAAVTDGGGCPQVVILDALLPTTYAAQVRRILPQALYQCAQADLEADKLVSARTGFQRIINEYPQSVYIAKARQNLQVVVWFERLVAGRNTAIRKVCEESATWVQAGAATLVRPYGVQIYGRNWDNALPSDWRVSRITVVVCVGDTESNLIQRCPYTGGCSIERYRKYYPARIVNPVTGLTVAQMNIYGTYPNTCPYTEWFSGYGATKEYYGSIPDESDLVTWLARYIK